MKIAVKLVKLDPNLPTPAYQTVGSAGCDVPSRKELVIPPHQRMLVPTGLKMEIPEGFECQIRPRSGTALKHGITVLNSPSTIDSDYRGEVGVVLINTSDEPFTVKQYDRIAQFVFAPVTVAEFELVDELSTTDRGAKGFGSTGRQ
jgi:dUTP pyrophosphatase